MLHSASGPKDCSRRSLAQARASTCRLNAATTKRTGSGAPDLAIQQWVSVYRFAPLTPIGRKTQSIELKLFDSGSRGFHPSIAQLLLFEQRGDPFAVFFGNRYGRIAFVVDFAGEVSVILTAGENGLKVQDGVAIAGPNGHAQTVEPLP